MLLHVLAQSPLARSVGAIEAAGRWVVACQVVVLAEVVLWG